MEGDVACGSWDLYRNKAGFEYVETLEETLVYSISIETLNELYKSDIDIANWMRVLQREIFFAYKIFIYLASTCLRMSVMKN